jgi:hypothetical protein
MRSEYRLFLLNDTPNKMILGNGCNHAWCPNTHMKQVSSVVISRYPTMLHDWKVDLRTSTLNGSKFEGWYSRCYNLIGWYVVVILPINSLTSISIFTVRFYMCHVAIYSDAINSEWKLPSSKPLEVFCGETLGFPLWTRGHCALWCKEYTGTNKEMKMLKGHLMDIIWNVGTLPWGTTSLFWRTPKDEVG